MSPHVPENGEGHGAHAEAHGEGVETHGTTEAHGVGHGGAEAHGEGAHGTQGEAHGEHGAKAKEAPQTAHERQASSMADKAAREKKRQLMNIRIQDYAGECVWVALSNH